MKLLRYGFTSSSTDNFWSPIPISDWLISCCGNLIIYQKGKKNKKDKYFDEKQQKKAKKVKIKQRSLLWTRSTDPWGKMLETLEIRREYRS